MSDKSSDKQNMYQDIARQDKLEQLQAENKTLKTLCDCLYNGIDEEWAETEIGQKIVNRYMEALKGSE